MAMAAGVPASGSGCLLIIETIIINVETGGYVPGLRSEPGEERRHDRQDRGRSAHRLVVPDQLAPRFFVGVTGAAFYLVGQVARSVAVPRAAR
jgi:hypothetical protein